MTRLDFIRRMMGAAAAVTLSPLLDLAPIEPCPEAACPEVYEFHVFYFFNLDCHNPRRLGVVTGIS